MTRPISAALLLSALLAVGACDSGPSAEERLAKARIFIDNAKYQSAVIELKNALQQDKNSAEARLLLGRTYLQIGDVLSADKELRAAASMGANPDEITPLLAESLLLQGDFVKIRELSAEGLSPQPLGELMAVQALAESAQGEDGAAQMLMERADELAPDSSKVQLSKARLLVAQNDSAAGLVVLDALLISAPGNLKAWSLKGDILAMQGDAPGAIVAYTEVLSLDANSFSARMRRGLLLFQSNQFDNVQADADQLLAMAPQSPAGNYLQGLLYFQQQNYSDAILALTLAEPAYTVYPMVLFYLGSANFIEGNVDQATEFAQRFVAAAPGNIAGRKLLATLALRRGDHREVYRALQPILDYNGDDVDALNLMSNALIRDGRTDEGIAMLSKIAELQPDSPAAQVRLGAGQLLQGKNPDAVTNIERALELNPEFQQADILLVLNYVRNQEFDKAIEAGKAYVGRNPAQVAAHNLLARVYLSAGMQDQAIASLNESLRLDAGDPGANQTLAALSFASKDFDAARKYYDTVLEHYPDQLAAMLGLARLDGINGDQAAFVSRLQKAMSAHPAALQPRLMLAEYYLRAGKPEQVAPLFSTLDKVQQEAPQVKQAMAIAYLDTQQFEQASQLLAGLLEDNPDNVGNQHLMARATAGGGDIDATRMHLEKALALNAEHLPSLLALARLQLNQQDQESFRLSLSSLLELAPKAPEVKRLQARAAFINGDRPAAADLAGAAYKLAPSVNNLLIWTGYLEAAGDIDKARTLLQQALLENPGETAIELALGINLGQSGDSSGSIAQYRKLLQESPSNFIALNNLAWELRQTDNVQALGYARKAVEIQPENAAALDTLAVVEYLGGDLVGARRSIRRALDIAPGAPSLVYHEAMIEAARGESGTARDILQTLLERGTEFPEMAEAQALLDTLK